MNLQAWLRWWLRLILPVLGWRVPVLLLRGPARGSGRQVVLLRAGRSSEFLAERFFAQEPVVERSTRVPVWRLQRLLDEWRGGADLVAVEIDRISSRLFVKQPHALAVPLWLSSLCQVPPDLQTFTRRHKSAHGDIRRIEIKKFESHLSRAPQDLDYFYDRFYVPFITSRHGGKVSLVTRWRMRLMFRQGMLHWVSRGGERLTGGLVMVRKRRFFMVLNGLLDGRPELLRDGALSALYVHALLEARKLGCTEINMGGSMPSLLDGVFRYKNKWTSELRLFDGAVSSNCVTLLSWDRTAGPVAEFFQHTPLIYHDQGGFSALWAAPTDPPLTAETLRQQYQHLKASGLHRLDILLPADVPAGFVCPAGVRLIPWGAVALGGAQLLAGSDPATAPPGHQASAASAETQPQQQP